MDENQQEKLETEQKMLFNQQQQQEEEEEQDGHELIAKDKQISRRYTIYIEAIPISIINQIKEHNINAPLLLWQIYDIERKISVLHTLIKRTNQQIYDIPIKGKDELITQVGFRRFLSRPIYSQDVTNSDKNLIERYLVPDRWTIASFYERITFTPSPVLFFGSKQLINNVIEYNPMIANGKLTSINPDQLLIKRIILTGAPIHVHKRAAVVRYMFFNPEDIKYFKKIELRTKLGHIGHIKESRGTKGYMKCMFDGHIKHHDTVCLNLYKRQYPKWEPEKFKDSITYL